MTRYSCTKAYCFDVVRLSGTRTLGSVHQAFALSGKKAMSEDPQDIGPDSVTITENMGDWFVRVVQDGKANVTTFEVESFARTFAEGQRLGLKLRKITES